MENKPDKSKLLKTYNIYSNYEIEHQLVSKIHSYLQPDMSEYYVLEPVEGVERKYMPAELYGFWRFDVGLECQMALSCWLEERVVPKTRQLLDVALAQVGLTHWDLDELIKLNHGRANDGFEVEIEYAKV